MFGKFKYSCSEKKKKFTYLLFNQVENILANLGLICAPLPEIALASVPSSENMKQRKSQFLQIIYGKEERTFLDDSVKILHYNF